MRRNIQGARGRMVREGLGKRRKQIVYETKEDVGPGESGQGGVRSTQRFEEWGHVTRGDEFVGFETKKTSDGRKRGKP